MDWIQLKFFPLRFLFLFMSLVLVNVLLMPRPTHLFKQNIKGQKGYVTIVVLIKFGLNLGLLFFVIAKTGQTGLIRLCSSKD